MPNEATAQIGPHYRVIYCISRPTTNSYLDPATPKVGLGAVTQMSEKAVKQPLNGGTE